MEGIKSPNRAISVIPTYSHQRLLISLPPTRRESAIGAAEAATLVIQSLSKGMPHRRVTIGCRLRVALFYSTTAGRQVSTYSIEGTSMQCPHCHRWSAIILPTVLVLPSGELKFVVLCDSCSDNQTFSPVGEKNRNSIKVIRKC